MCCSSCSRFDRSDLGPFAASIVECHRRLKLYNPLCLCMTVWWRTRWSSFTLIASFDAFSLSCNFRASCVQSKQPGRKDALVRWSCRRNITVAFWYEGFVVLRAGAAVSTWLLRAMRQDCLLPWLYPKHAIQDESFKGRSYHLGRGRPACRTAQLMYSRLIHSYSCGLTWLPATRLLV